MTYKYELEVMTQDGYESKGCTDSIANAIEHALRLTDEAAKTQPWPYYLSAYFVRRISDGKRAEVSVSRRPDGEWFGFIIVDFDGEELIATL